MANTRILSLNRGKRINLWSVNKHIRWNLCHKYKRDNSLKPRTVTVPSKPEMQCLKTENFLTRRRNTHQANKRRKNSTRFAPKGYLSEWCRKGMPSLWLPLKNACGNLQPSLSRRASRTFRECANERGGGYALGSLENKNHRSRRIRSPSTAQRRPRGGRRYQSFKTHIRRTSKVTPELTVRMNGQINDNA